MKNITIIFSILSAIGISYFVLTTWISIGVGATPANVFITALVVTLIPLWSAWHGVFWVKRAVATLANIWRTLTVLVLPWAWLFIGSIYLALLRFQ